MTLIIEIALGVLFGFWLKNRLVIWGNLRNIIKCRDAFLILTPSDLIVCAIDGHDFAYTRSEREYLIELAIETDESRRRKLAEAIAQNAAGRLAALKEGKAQPSVMSDLDNLWLKEMKVKVEPWRLMIMVFDQTKMQLCDEARQNMRQALGL